jgi:hypothetical protein
MSNSCLRQEFTVIVEALDVVVYGVYADLEKIGQKALGKPDGLILEADLDMVLAVLGPVEGDFGAFLRQFRGQLVHSVLGDADDLLKCSIHDHALSTVFGLARIARSVFRISLLNVSASGRFVK